MSSAPEHLKYADSHEWASLDADGVVTVGITEHAQDALGDIVFVELPEVDQALVAGDTFGVVESVKAASDVYAPVSGRVIEINEALIDAPETVNEHPYADGWFIKIQADDTAELEQLKSAEDYLASVE